MLKKVLSMIISGVMVLSLAGCGNSVSDNETEGGTKVEDTKKETLIVYTNSGSDGRDQWLVDKAAEAGFSVQVLEMGASDLTNRIIAEKNNSIADVMFGLNNIEYEKLKAEDLLAEWRPNWVDGVDQGLLSGDGYYYPVSTTPLVLIYNNEMENPPSDWTDLNKDEYKGLYQLHGLSGGTGKTVFASIISRYLDENGELGISEEGWNIAAQYLENAHIIADGEDSIGAVIDGTLPMDMHWASGVITEEKARNYEFGIMSPEVGVPFVVESVAINKNTKKAELAEEFLNWLGSAEVQLAWSNDWGTIPAQEEALDKVDESISKLVDKVHPQELDWELISKNIDAWVEKAELEYVQ